MSEEMLNKVNTSVLSDSIKEQFADALANLISYSFRKKQFEKCINLYKKDIKVLSMLFEKRNIIKNKVGEAFYNVGMERFKAKDIPKAIEHIKQAIQIESQMEWKNTLSSIYIELGNKDMTDKAYSSAIKHFEEAVQFNPTEENKSLLHKAQDTDIKFKKETTSKIRKRIIGIVSVCFLVIVLFYLYHLKQISDNYKNGVEATKNNQFENALLLFDKVEKANPNYKGLTEARKETHYQWGLSLLKNREYEKALQKFNTVGDYKDVKEQIKETHYQWGLSSLKNREYEKALQEFDVVGDYKDAKEQKYQQGIVCINEKEYNKAINIFRELGDYKDSKNKVNEINPINTIGIEFILIPAGSFTMGSNDGDSDEKPPHTVTISRPFYIGKYEVTQKQWVIIMGNNPSGFKGGNNPVENVSWNDVQEFIRKLNAKEGTTAYRLPTEAEWEYACRAGSTTKYCFGNDKSQLGQYAWYEKNSDNKTHPVGQLQANAWGLYDMHGNVWEWCEDWYGEDYYSSSPSTDP
jgi:formylglycine-generating enzyme required for sulfatase activity